MKKTVLFTGGHHNSALEVALALREKGYQIVWLGHKFTSKGDKSLSAEYQEITKNNIRFIELKTGKFYRKHFDPIELIKIALGFIQSFTYLLKIKPDLIFSSGGYLSVPVVICGWILGIPSVTHEQTVVAGWANKAISRFVKKIMLTHESSLQNYPKEKSLVVGLPIRKQLLDKKFEKEFSPKLIYVTCGKQGSHVINSALFPLIPKLVKKYTIIHQTGSNTLYKDQERARRIKERLGELKNHYQYSSYFFGDEAATYLKSSEIVISRSGAHISYELMLLGKKSVLIPIPWVSHNEQLENAKLVSQHTKSVVLEEKDLSPQSLEDAIIKLEKIKSSKNQKPALPTNATQKIVGIVEEMVA